jgi:hypothetical protein
MFDIKSFINNLMGKGGDSKANHGKSDEFDDDDMADDSIADNIDDTIEDELKDDEHDGEDSVPNKQIASRKKDNSFVNDLMKDKKKLAIYGGVGLSIVAAVFLLPAILPMLMESAPKVDTAAIQPEIKEILTEILKKLNNHL